MYEIDDMSRVIHGGSYAVALDTIEFITWRLNEETNNYWVKMHLPSGKEIRIKISANDLTELVNQRFNGDIDLELGDEDELDF